MSHQVVTDHSVGKRRRYRQPSPDSPFSRCIPWRTLEYDSKSRTRRLILRYPLVNKHSNGKSWKITIFNGKIHYKWQFSIAMLVYQRVLWNIKFMFETTNQNMPGKMIIITLYILSSFLWLGNRRRNADNKKGVVRPWKVIYK